jgi:hypothetical protein
VLGIDFRDDAQLALLREAFPKFLAEFDYPIGPTGDARAYYQENTQFGGLDARALFVMLRSLAPARVIEIGSGWSSLLTADVNRRFFGGRIDVTCIEPYPRPFLRAGVEGLSRLVVERVQDVPPSTFEPLGRGDVLFIDSSHVSKTGSDVNHLVFEVLPRLKPGVVVHFHDVFLPDDYPEDWVIGDRRSWNEQYVLRALLMDSTAYEIVLAVHYMTRRHRDVVDAIVGARVPGGGSLWVRRT